METDLPRHPEQQGRNQDLNLEGAKLKKKKKFMKIKTNTYFIFNKILHIK